MDFVIVCILVRKTCVILACKTCVIGSSAATIKVSCLVHILIMVAVNNYKATLGKDVDVSNEMWKRKLRYGKYKNHFIGEKQTRTC